MLTRRTVIGVMLEAVYGTDPGSASYVLAWDVDPDVKGEVLERAVLRDTLSPMPHVVGVKEVSVAFKTELKAAGVGSAGSVPEMDVLLQGCGFGTAIHTGTNPIVYSLKSAEADMKSVSFYLYLDGNKHKITGARGTVKFNMEAGKYGICEWEFQGIYNAVSADTIPDISAALVEAPPIIYNADFQIGGFTPVCSRCMIDLANDVVRRDDLNADYGVHSFRITGRKPTMEFDADTVVESSNPFWGDWAGDVLASYAVSVGTGVANLGQQIELSGFFQYETNKYADSDGVRTYECVAALVSSDVNSQNDELKITFGIASA